MARTYQFIVGQGEAGLRLDRYLSKHLPEAISRMMIQRRVREGAVTIGERPVKAHQRLHAGDVVLARFEQLPARSTSVTLTPQHIPLDIVYEDAEVLVVHKPPGLVTHPAPGHWDGTLVNAILWHFNQHTAHGTQHTALPRAGIVHRLDKDTSGLLVVAKTETAHVALSKQLKARTMKRRYLALVEGHVPLNEGTVRVAIGRHLTHRKVMTARHLGGRSAVTHYRILKRYTTEGSRLPGPPIAIAGAGKALGKDIHPAPSTSHLSPFLYTLLEVSLETGRTHQIRVHMAHLGHPVVGDTTYGKRPVSFWQSLGITRQLLHAYSIHFLHPATRKLLALKAPIPEDLRHWIGDVREVSI